MVEIEEDCAVFNRASKVNGVCFGFVFLRDWLLNLTRATFLTNQKK